MKKILFGLTAWGRYLDLFFDYGLPSLMAEGNLPELAKYREIIFNIHTDKEGYKKLLYSKIPYLWYAKTDVTNEDKYEQIGRHQNDDLRTAKEIGADYHLCLPDFIYSDNCFKGIIEAVERGHKAIVRLVMSTVQEDMLPELDRPRSAIDLATLAFKHRHPGISNWFISPKGYPQTHVVAYVAKDTIRMQSPHCSPVYIANEVIHTGSDVCIDAILDQVIIGDIYCPKPQDGIVMIEVSPRDSRRPQYNCVELGEFCRIFRWDTKNSPRQHYIFEQETVDAIDRKALGDNNYWGDIEIERMKETIYNALNN